VVVVPEPTHDCPCGGQVRRALFACRAGWYRLPLDLRDAISHARRGTHEHRAAMRDAIRWYGEHPAPAPTTPGRTR
jgi:hypothetical protein